MSSHDEPAISARRAAPSSSAPPSRTAGTLLLLSATIMAGCYQSHLCPEETCNLRDDDCDGLIDEGFADEIDGAYRTIEHCGTCGIDCRDVFPTAEEVACQDDPAAGPVCVLVSCPLGFHRAGDGACVPDVPVLCLPCTTDGDCALRLPGARCLATGSGQTRCGQPCDATAPCPDGFACTDGQCTPASGWCGCDETTAGAELACLLRAGPDGHACVGVQRCGAGGPADCEPALGEACNAQDDDCDGEVDEDYRDEQGRFLTRLHCGGCAMPCVEPGPNMLAECLPEGAMGARCEVNCLEGFVDVDRILANGCECERWTGMGPPPAIGGDADCDGVPDDTDQFIYVTTAGSDTNPGTLARPMRTLGAAIARGRAVNKDVLVARGIYAGPLDVVAGVSVFGGYSPDFRDRDLELFPVVIERAGGLPALTCRGVRAATRIEGFTVSGADATGPGEGSTAVYSDGCGPEVELVALTIFAGRGAAGVDGADSSENLADWGLMSLAQLDGPGGGGGRDGTGGGTCTRIAAGNGGRHSCRARDVSGGNGGDAACPESGCTQGRPCGNAGCTDFTTGGVCDFDAVLRAAVPNPAAQAGRGLDPGTAGSLTYNAPTNRGVCNFCDDNPTLPRDTAIGGDGGSGDDGGGGVGCNAPAVLDESTGRLHGGPGTGGAPGVDGSGGGGGGPGAGYDVIGGTEPGCSDRAGGSGGGGGAGGCGAPAADGGTGGGSSAGIVIRLASGLSRGPRFEEVRVVTASGGAGGDGGIGADGGRGGVGGNGGVALFWCARTGGRGGDGGRGGAGGGGGGGCGGGSYGVYLAPRGGDASAYAAELGTTLAIEEAGVAGRGGRGGFSPGTAGTTGLDGSAASIFVAP
ncbi:MAG: hypothetical protein IT378_23325 [Sandaracinaceae bacterium]|nr:hypothetical protein [Sandaracinaceae bacterium]